MDDISSPPRKPSPTARISESPAQGVLKVAWGHDFKPDHDSRPNKKCLRDPRRQSVASSPEVQPGYQLRGVRPNPRIEGSCDADAENLPKSRVSHNMVEKMYRTRLNTQFTSLLEAIPTEITVLQFDGYVDTGGRRGRVSKGDVLTLAKGYIRTLEEGKRSLEQENEENQATINLLRMALVKSGGRYCG
ncbi:hypothetical protein N431DRAFT_364866 [Stipitochalara longipes BDJ]|nr:hypothetical protein N431DRAFT_364866 [Stipitochalara longipes BDJ]